MYTKQEAIEQMNKWGRQHEPFLFIVDFECNSPLLYPLDSVPDNIHYSVNDAANSRLQVQNEPFSFEANPIVFETYEKSFQKVIEELNYGNSYLLNLTFPTPLKTSLNLRDVFARSKARYKLLVDAQFVVFSPEPFVQIKNGVISSYPMKGTIDAAIPNAKEVLLNDPKELAEHATIVDLIRNDLSMVATDVQVTNYRYVEEVKTFSKKLLQVSSKIEGILSENHHSKLGSIIFKLLPAGSISGAPKKKTVEVIKANEPYNRGYFTGVFGVFDGQNLDSGVIIRFIENINGQLVFKSGGGITAKSSARSEYQELIDKVYVPFI